MRQSPVVGDDLRALGLKPGAGWPEIQAAYRRLALALHPDVHIGEDHTRLAEEFRGVTQAYESLRRRHIEERRRTRGHIEQISADPVAAELSIEELELRLRYSSSPQLRAASALLLGARAEAPNKRILRVALGDPDPQVRGAAIEGLRKVGTIWDVMLGQAKDRLMRLGGERTK
ncbi:MAG TPA: DnaJ domain-containing protein [Spirochaetia bacterium]|nr:DnaJ domain-containing protein [Spirochaetia bacterium]